MNRLILASRNFRPRGKAEKVRRHLRIKGGGLRLQRRGRAFRRTRRIAVTIQHQSARHLVVARSPLPALSRLDNPLRRHCHRRRDCESASTTAIQLVHLIAPEHGGTAFFSVIPFNLLTIQSSPTLLLVKIANPVHQSPNQGTIRRIPHLCGVRTRQYNRQSLQ